MKSEKLLYSKEEAAENLGLSVHTITRDVRLGRIASRRYGRRVLIPAAEITRIANEGMRPEHAAN
jgi:excisionase family DNA binding protein